MRRFLIFIFAVTAIAGAQAGASDNTVPQQPTLVPTAFLMDSPQVPEPTHVTSRILSPKCDEARLRGLMGLALITITKEGAEVFNVTLDIAKMDFLSLTRVMFSAGCY